MRARSTRTVLIVSAGLATAIVAAAAILLTRGGSADAAPVSALGEGTAMGAVELASSDPEALAEFYTAGVGLEVLAEEEAAVSLGVGGAELLRIVTSDAPADDPAEAGLYHSAFLFPDESSLAEAILRTAQAYPSSFDGSADHTVSQAFYFADPDGNGVELYVDRPAESWLWTEGEVTMGSYALDPNAFISEHLDAEAGITVPDGVVMGHVHLRGGSLEEAEAFYEDALGMAVTARATGALFFSADGYHHHLAVNVWSSEGAGARPESQGLSVVTVTVAGADELDALEQRLTDSGVAYVREDQAVRTEDPWGTRIVVTA
ncbi:VOC family protein [Demequina sp. NBRC 110054]|uniref:VOC family protein n=1 Tax=Demequina sp. NBRC 110054 TaxID=1570343 RepID=UPI000A0385AD|nr:VOC family protein [Demequina sp. NBRC 110054]